MGTQNFVSYLRVSTKRQGVSGLGIEAQREAVRRHIEQCSGDLVGEYVETESGKNNDRPQLKEAMQHARDTGSILIVAKLDRLARSASFLLTIIDGVSSVVFCDFPQVPPGPAGRLILTILAAVAEMESGMTSERTKAALAAAKARGVKLGNPNLRHADRQSAKDAMLAAREAADAFAARVLPYIEQARSAGASNHYQIARALEARGVKTRRGSTRWNETQVSRVLSRAPTTLP